MIHLNISGQHGIMMLLPGPPRHGEEVTLMATPAPRTKVPTVTRELVLHHATEKNVCYVPPQYEGAAFVPALQKHWESIESELFAGLGAEDEWPAAIEVVVRVKPAA